MLYHNIIQTWHRHVKESVFNSFLWTLVFSIYFGIIQEDFSATDGITVILNCMPIAVFYGFMETTMGTTADY